MVTKDAHGLKVHIADGKDSKSQLLFACGRIAPRGSSHPYVGCAHYKGRPGQTAAELAAVRAQVTCAGCRKAYAAAYDVVPINAPPNAKGMPARDRRQLDLALERESRAGAPAKGSRSGPNIPENDRRTVAVKLRLPRATADLLHELALRNGQTLSGAVGEILRISQAELDDGFASTIPPAVDAAAHDVISEAFPCDAKMICHVKVDTMRRLVRALEREDTSRVLDANAERRAKLKKKKPR